MLGLQNVWYYCEKVKLTKTYYIHAILLILPFHYKKDRATIKSPCLKKYSLQFTIGYSKHLQVKIQP